MSGVAPALSRVRVVLVQTTHPGNIGSTARAMKTMGLSRLVLVRPRYFPHPEAVALASGAGDLLDAAVVCESLDQALVNTTMSFAVSARRRELSLESSDARHAAGLAVTESATGEVAWVFGTEMSGLSNEDVLRCRRLVQIPTDPGYSSLNLAQAVQVIAYELWVAYSAWLPQASSPIAAAPLATHEELEYLFAHWQRACIDSGFLDPVAPRRLMERIRRLFGRTRLEKEEMNILRGMLAAFEKPLPPR